jgi:hypothetical protein
VSEPKCFFGPGLPLGPGNLTNEAVTSIVTTSRPLRWKSGPRQAETSVRSQNLEALMMRARKNCERFESPGWCGPMRRFRAENDASRRARGQARGVAETGLTVPADAAHDPHDQPADGQPRPDRADRPTGRRVTAARGSSVCHHQHRALGFNRGQARPMNNFQSGWSNRQAVVAESPRSLA